MDRLISPWRYSYVTGKRPEGCAFCEAQTREDGPDNLIVLRRRHAFLLLNMYPYNSGHCMVLPLRHVVDPSELSAEESADLWGLVAETADRLRKELRAEGVNVGVNLGRVSGGSIDHLHVHLVPRWQGDTNFMPIVAKTKVLVEMLNDTYARFAEAFGTGARPARRGRAKSGKRSK
jgi:ATP adenylyltransferase